ncbi:MAG TPA: hypothetical protein VFV87_15425, partial [Pirellulaceae bacterium]|nr:hypothetical protein [Pirellulaceae bacterium]
MSPQELSAALPEAALAFRGYNVTNLGRSGELLAHAAYGPTVERHLHAISQAASQHLGRTVDLVSRVRGGVETSIESYGDAIALIIGMECAQRELMEQHFGIKLRTAQFSFGYSLGEISALIGGGAIEAADALRIPLSLADDCVALAAEATLGVLFTRATELPLEDVREVCLRINAQGRGVIGISSHLAPNSVLLIGQHDTLDRFAELARGMTTERLHLRKNE